jgi:lipopolysaccharide/colanic/teichoic acid biosynthesis glycosyltransferase
VLDVRTPLLNAPRLTVEVQQAALIPSQRALKRTIDLGLALTTVIMLLPLMAIAAIAIELDSPGSYISSTPLRV